MDVSEIEETDCLQGNSVSARFCTIQDVPWMVELAKNKFKFIDPQHTAEFLNMALQDANAVIMRTENACVGIACYSFPYNRTFVMAEELFLASDSKKGWEFYSLLKIVLEKLQKIGVYEFKFDVSSFSKAGKNLSPIAKRLGAEKIESVYRIKFKTVH